MQETIGSSFVQVYFFYAIKKNAQKLTANFKYEFRHFDCSKNVFGNEKKYTKLTAIFKFIFLIFYTLFWLSSIRIFFK